MRLRFMLVVVTILLLAAFAALNWSAFAAPTRLSLLFVSFDAPLGLLMLGVLTLVVLAFAAYMALWQAKVLTDSRLHARELEHQRVLADQAEASRFTELRSLVHTEIEGLGVRLTQMQEGMRTDIRENTNSLAASIGEMDDRLRRDGAA